MKAAQSPLHLCHCRRHHSHITHLLFISSWLPVLGYEAMRGQKSGLLGPVEQEDQVGDKFGFSQDHDAGDLMKIRMRGLQ